MYRRIIKSPYLNLIRGIILLFTASYETWVTSEDVTVDFHHGVLVFSVIKIIPIIPVLTHSLNDIDKSVRSINN